MQAPSDCGYLTTIFDPVVVQDLIAGVTQAAKAAQGSTKPYWGLDPEGLGAASAAVPPAVQDPAFEPCFLCEEGVSTPMAAYNTLSCHCTAWPKHGPAETILMLFPELGSDQHHTGNALGGKRFDVLNLMPACCTTGCCSSSSALLGSWVLATAFSWAG